MVCGVCGDEGQYGRIGNVPYCMACVVDSIRLHAWLIELGVAAPVSLTPMTT